MIAYRSYGDGHLDYYWYRAPRTWSGGRRALFIRFHSAGGWFWRAANLRAFPQTNPLGGGSIPDEVEVTPCLRGDSIGRGLGHAALIAFLEDALSRFRPDVVYAGGASLGGTTAIQTAVRFRIFSGFYMLTGGDHYGLVKDHPYLDASLNLQNLSELRTGIITAPSDAHYRDNLAIAAELGALGYPVMLASDPNGGHGVIDPDVRDPVIAFVKGAPTIGADLVRKPFPEGGCLEALEQNSEWMLGGVSEAEAQRIWKQVWGAGDGAGQHYTMPRYAADDQRLIAPNMLFWMVGTPWDSDRIADAVASVPGLAWTPPGVTWRGVFYPGASLIANLPDPWDPSGASRLIVLPPDTKIKKLDFYKLRDLTIRSLTASGRERVHASFNL